MRRYGLLTILIWLCTVMALAQPFCRIIHYDENDGLSQRSVKQIAQDKMGMIWMATWSGLNRFDGKNFQVVKSRVGDGSGVYSDRFNDVRLSSSGNLWCRIDQRPYIFDVKTYKLIDFLKPIEQKTKLKFVVNRMRAAEDGTTIMECENNLFLTVSDLHPSTSYKVTHAMPSKIIRTIGNLQYRKLGNFTDKDLIYSGTDSNGTIWAVTSDGSIWYTSAADQPLTKLEQELPETEKLYFALIDSQGNLWLRSPIGAFKLTFGRYPYTTLPNEGKASGRAFLSDNKGRVWVACKDGTVRLYDRTMHLQGYLNAQGNVQPVRTSFGADVYCFFQDKDGQLWLGTKPNGLFRLREQSEGHFAITHFSGEGTPVTSLLGPNVYDMAQDGMGRLWVATMGGGLNIVENPTAEQPRFVHYRNGLKNYPAEGMSLRRILISRSGVALLASTEGLIVTDARQRQVTKMSFRDHVGESDRTNSLSNVAVMDLLEDKHGRVFVATESGGVNLIEDHDLMSPQFSFRHLDISNGLGSDVAFSLMAEKNHLWVVGDHCLTKIAFNGSNKSVPLDSIEVYDRYFWKNQMYFSEAHPIPLSNGTYLFGLEDGVIYSSLALSKSSRFVPPIVLTGITVQSQPVNYAVAAVDTLRLNPKERNVTISFAALDYEGAEQISYAFCLENEDGDDSPWQYLGTNQFVTLLDLDPGTYQLHIRSTNSSGRWVNNILTVTIEVEPTFWETTLAKILFVCLLLGFVFAVLRVIHYIKSIKRKQKETLNAYLELLGRTDLVLHQSDVDSVSVDSGEEILQTVVHEHPAEEIQRPKLKPEDEDFMKRVLEFVETHISDADTNIDDMAAATFTSKSGLNRKMKSLLGVTPAEFLRESRLQRAAQLLSTTNRSIQDIALACGFADQNYFSKCFKSQRGVSPSQYRSEGQ